MASSVINHPHFAFCIIVFACMFYMQRSYTTWPLILSRKTSHFQQFSGWIPAFLFFVYISLCEHMTCLLTDYVSTLQNKWKYDYMSLWFIMKWWFIIFKKYCSVWPIYSINLVLVKYVLLLQSIKPKMHQVCLGVLSLTCTEVSHHKRSR